MGTYYEAKFSDGHAVMVTANTNEEFMEYMVRQHDSSMKGGATVTVKHTGKEGTVTGDTFQVSPEGYGAYKRLVDMDQE